MRQRVFAICDAEEAYAARLMEYMIEKVRLPYAFHLFTEAEELQKFLQREKVEILLIAENALKLLREEYVRRQVEQMFVLREGEGTERSDTACISKLQSPQAILGMMAESIGETSGWDPKETAPGAEVKLIGVYSPVKRCLQTTFALTLGQILAREHRTLYLNFENYSGFGQMLRRDFSLDMMDLMYYFRCDRERLAIRLPAVIQDINGLDYIPPTQSVMGMREADGKQWLELCEYVAAIREYEYVILDLDDAVDGLFDLLRHCSRIYTITKEDSFAVAKLNQYEQILKFNEMDEIADRTVKCKFPVFKEIPRDLDALTYGELAGYVKAIVKEDLYGE